MVSRSPVGTMAQSCAQAQAWVRDNYERNTDGVVAKSVIYKNYEDYCREHNRPIMETSIFGRVVKQVFPGVNIRRLGGRENLKYYYCGIHAQESSPYVSDNNNTTRPKRKQRKRDVITDKAEAHNMFLWLCANYAEESESTIPISDIYSHYIQCSATWTNEPLSNQQFTTLITSVFFRIAKRKIGPKSPQQNVFVGIAQRPVPLDSASASQVYASLREAVASAEKFASVREGSHTPDDDDEYSCRTPESEGSDMSAGNSENSCSEIKQECLPDSFHLFDQHHHHESVLDDSMFKNEPVDYSIGALRLKDEPVESMAHVKEEKLGVSHMTCFSLGTPNSRTSHLLDSPSPSPSPPQKSSKNRIYKPRFHIDYHDSNWSSIPEIKSENNHGPSEIEDNGESVLRTWLLECLEVCEDVGVNSEQLYAYYLKYCNMINTKVLHYGPFGYVLSQTFPTIDLVSFSSGVTVFAGVRVVHNSDIDRRVDEVPLRTDALEISQSWDSQHQPSLERNSPPCLSSSPINLEDEEDDEDILDDGFSGNRHGPSVIASSSIFRARDIPALRPPFARPCKKKSV
ncbi:uncharacterized protein LOC108665925 isoform X2 [Hyalella azteca]|uniref:Uncharacterized protein LOC108665925 isoform X2 n=1 Tax=Hyalella azteca TaxID=294128 RepID=A0A8B7N4M4_HYAAZ|nr:uncharacterized protein LOC108665925 isoform X2 [Hyalella azteca]